MIFRWLSLTFWLLFGLYVGLGGWQRIEIDTAISQLREEKRNPDEFVVYKQVSFSSPEQLETFLEKERINLLFPWVFALPSFLAFVVAGCGFAALGSVVTVLKRIVVDKKELDTDAYVAPLFGLLIGLFVIAMVYIVPLTLVDARTSDIRFRTPSLLLLCLFGGAFSRQAYDWVEKRVAKLFSEHREND